MMDSLPSYLVEVKARQLFLQDPTSSKSRWEDTDETVRQGYLEIAKTLLVAQATQSDIKR